MRIDDEHVNTSVASEVYGGEETPDSAATPDIIAGEVLAASTEIHRRKTLGWYGTVGLKCAGAVVVLGTPPAAHGINQVVHESPTHVPVHIAGADVTVQQVPGSNLNNFTILDQRFTTYSNRKIGRKDVGFNVIADTSNVSKADPDFAPNSATMQNLFKQFTDLTAQKHEVGDAVIQHSREQFLKGFGEGLGLELLALAGAGFVYRRAKNYSSDPSKRAAVQDFLQTEIKPYAVGTAALLMCVPIATLGQTYFSPNHPQTVTADPNLDCTPLKGAELNGLLKTVVDTAVPNACSFIENTNTYYSNAEASFTQQFEKTYGVKVLEKKPGVYRMIYGDDLQGIPMGKLLGLAAQMYNADAIDVGGDINGTESIEETDVADTLNDSAKDTPVVWVSGHHDNKNTEQIMKERGFIHANGAIQKVGPFSVYGVNDAETIDGMGLTAHEITPGVDNAQLTSKAIDYLCSDAVQKLSVRPIFISHDDAIGNAVAKTGCVPTVLSGREYFEKPAINYGNQTIDINSGSTGGHGPNEGIHIFGTPKYDATFHVLDIDAKTQRILDYQVITVSSDINATVSFGPTFTPSETQNAPLSPPYRNNYQAAGSKSHRRFEASRSLPRHQGSGSAGKRQRTGRG